MEGAGAGPPAGRGGRGAALLAALKAKQKRPGDDEGARVGLADGGAGVSNQQPPPVQDITPTPQPSGSPHPLPVGRAALLSGLTGRSLGGVASSVSAPSVGRAALLEKLKIKGGVASSLASVGTVPGVGRAQLLASLKGGVSVVGSSSGQSQGGTVSPGVETRVQSPPGGITPPPGKVSPTAAATVSPTALAKPMSGMMIQEEGGDPIIRKGTAGKTVKLTANYVRLEMEGEKGMYEYEVKFNPLVDSRDERFKLVGQQRELFGPTKTFDGICLYLPHQLDQVVTVVKGTHPVDQSEVTLTMSLKHKKRLADKACIQFYNTLFRRIMTTLKMCQMNKNFYDPTAGHLVPQHKLEIWPGYVTSVQQFEGGVMLCCDVSHKVLRTQTAYQLLKDVVAQKPADMQGSVLKALLGAVVLTRYNNKCYKVDDIDWDMTPSSKFVDHNGEEKSFVDYYKKHYGITIKDEKQPMLINRAKKKTAEEADVAKLIALVPELCNLTGLTDQMKNDFRVMKDVALFTRVTPNQRQLALRKFLKNVNDSAEASSHLLNWGLRLAPDAIKLEGRLLNPEKLMAGKNFQFTVNSKADWGREITTNHMLTAVDLKKWSVVFVQKNDAVVQNFVSLMIKLSPKMGMKVAQPEMNQLANDRTETYLKAIRDNVNPNVQLVVAIMPTPRDDRYSAVKKLCCVEKPVPSQVINFKTISNEKKVSSVVQKVALQINCKLGGELWGCSIPPKLGNLMVLGVDVYHDPSRRGSSIAGVVSSTNMSMSRWYSSTCFQQPGQELIDSLKIAFIKALKKFYEMNHVWPDKVMVFRDGVGDSQLAMSAKYEAEQFKDSFKHISDTYKPGFGFIVVQKRINTRIFYMSGKELDNPPPGTVLDHTVTRRDWYDFFLVSQHVGQGTVSPTHYVVVHDSMELPVDAVQRISYKLTHMYYNWPGTVRVPAPCQYAHKLAYQVGEHIHKEPSAKLEDRLFYL
eukprot:GFUD01025304.1.p1 GENE.GFUD01025304.1~~GFUD01025304.1.p1  ORF type:complete len:970 (+),score=314.12 GFUD01025304.1:89-2998(+)